MALRSNGHVFYDVGRLGIAVTGSKAKVHVFETSGTHGWITPLLKALRAAPYRRYTVVLLGGHSSQTRSLGRKLDEQDVAGSLHKFQCKYPGGYALVEISP